MSEVQYHPPKLIGQRAALNMRIQPEQHRRLWHRAKSLGLSQADYVGALIDRDLGLPNLIDDRMNSEQLPLEDPQQKELRTPRAS